MQIYGIERSFSEECELNLVCIYIYTYGSICKRNYMSKVVLSEGVISSLVRQLQNGLLGLIGETFSMPSSKPNLRAPVWLVSILK